MEKQKVLDLVVKHFDIPGFLADALDELLEPALDKLVKDTENPFDDMAKAALYPSLAPILKNLAKEKWEDLVEKD